MSIDNYQVITNKIITQMENGCAPWRKPWDGGSPLTLPKNKVTGKHYNGINIPILWLTAQEKNYEVNQWATYKQWAEKGEQVEKGEKGTQVVFYDTFEKELENKEIKKIPFIKTSAVFNICQLKGYEPKPVIDPPPLPIRIDRADKFVQRTGANIYPDSVNNAAYYDPKNDSIHMPSLSRFRGTETRNGQESYYSVLLHELTHWSGHKSRLNREMGHERKAYAFEELIAELGAAFLSASLEITDTPRQDHADYLDYWLKIMKEDKKAIFTASSAATKACDFLYKVREEKVLDI